jgi:hypothetical protein
MRFGQEQDIEGISDFYTATRINSRYKNAENNLRIPPYKHDFDGSYAPDTLGHIREYMEDLRYHSGIEVYPYPGGIEDLRTTLICTLNGMLNLIRYWEENGR